MGQVVFVPHLTPDCSHLGALFTLGTHFNYTVPCVVNRLEGRKVSSETEAHEGPVYAMYAYPSPDGSGTCLITGGGDGKIKTWDSEV